MGDAEKPNVNAIKELFDHPYFQLAVEKEVRERVDRYLRLLGAFALILLAVAGYGSWNLVDEARKKYDESSKKLDAQVTALTTERIRAEDKAEERENKSNVAWKESETLLTAAQKDLSSLTRNKEEIEIASQEAKHAREEATAAKTEAQAALHETGEQAKRLVIDATEARDKAVDAKKQATHEAEEVANAANQLKPRLLAEIQLMISKETTQVLVRGKKVPCVQLRNWLESSGNTFNISSNENPQSYYVQFRVVHMHLQPVVLHMDVLKNSCTSEEIVESYEYDGLPKSNSALRHPIPGTPFAFRMTFVYDPLLTYDFIVLAISPEEDLLRAGPEYKSDALYFDKKRKVASPLKAETQPSFPTLPVEEAGDCCEFGATPSS